MAVASSMVAWRIMTDMFLFNINKKENLPPSHRRHSMRDDMLWIALNDHWYADMACVRHLIMSQ